MKIIIPKSIGFCYGVLNSVKLAEEVLKKAGDRNVPCYCLDNLIHNPKVVDSFKKRGLSIINSPDKNEAGLVIISAHGTTKDTVDSFSGRGFELYDGTCINIKKTQQIIADSVAEGMSVLVIGIPGHAETKSLMGCTDGTKVFLVYNEKSLNDVLDVMDSDENICVVCQTTFPPEEFEKLASLIKMKKKSALIFNCLCNVCTNRMKEYKECALKSDVVFVIGGKDSQNTKNMAEYLSEYCSRVYQVEDESDTESVIREGFFKDKTVLLCSGTSTPVSIVEKIRDKLTVLESKIT